MVISVRDVVAACDTNAHGEVLFSEIAPYLIADQQVAIDFSGVFNVTSSFVNSSFVELVDQFGTKQVQRLVVLQGVNRQIGAMIKARLAKQFA